MLKPISKLFTLLLCLAPFLSNAQNAYKDCFGGTGVCNNTYTQTVLPPGIGNVQELNATNQGCLGMENNSAWYIINITSPGTLIFTITPVTPTEDYDFAVWDITGVGCPAIANNPPVRCNYATNGASGPNGTTGLSTTAPLPSYGAGGPGFSSAINALPGETYAILVDNFSNTSSGYTIDFTNSVASIYDTVKPFFTSATSYCGTVSDKINVTMSEPIRCNSLAADGSDFYLSPAPAGITITSASSVACTGTATLFNNFDIQFSGTVPAGTYYLHAKIGTDGNTLLDNCGNGQSISDSVKLILAPAGAPEVVKLDTPACNRATIVLSRLIRCNTVAINGSDFHLNGPSPVTIISAVPRTCNNGLADTIDLIYDRSILVAGNYTLSVGTGSDGDAILDTCGNVYSKPYTFYVSDAGYIAVSNANPLIVCNPDYIVLSANLTVPSTAVVPGFNWSGQYLSDSTAQYPTAYIPRTTSYTVQIMDTNACYRRSKLEVIVPIRHPELLSRDTAICLGDYVPLQIGGGVDYNWFPSTGLSCTNCPNPNASPTVTTRYYGVVFDQYGCSDTVSTLIKVNPLPIVSINAGRDTTIIYAQSVPLYVLSPGGKYYTWEPVTGLNNANIPNPIATPPITTTYTVYVTDTNQCRANAAIDVTVRRDIPVAVPSGFTPNGDGRNDYFRIANLTFQKVVEFRVFNRWGQEVFSGNDNTGWDGIYNGQKQDADVYKYIIRVAYPDGHTENFKGDVTLIR